MKLKEFIKTIKEMEKEGLSEAILVIRLITNNQPKLLNIEEIGEGYAQSVSKDDTGKDINENVNIVAITVTDNIEHDKTMH